MRASLRMILCSLLVAAVAAVLGCSSTVEIRARNVSDVTYHDVQLPALHTRAR